MSNLEKKKESLIAEHGKKYDKVSVMCEETDQKYQVLYQKIQKDLEKLDDYFEGVCKAYGKCYKELEEIEKTNSFFCGEYCNQIEKKTEVINALSYIYVLQEYEETIKGVFERIDKNFSFEKQFRNDVRNSMICEVEKTMSLKDEDYEEVLKIVSEKRLKGSKLVGKIFCIAFPLLFFFAIQLNAVSWILFFACVLGIIEGICFIRDSDQRKYIQKMTERKYKSLLIFSWRAAKKELQEADKFFAEWKTETEEQIKAKKDQIEEKISEYSSLFERKNNEWVSIKEKYSDRIDNYIKKGKEIITPSLKRIPKEFRSKNSVKDLISLLEANRADTLKEAYNILETRYRENARDRADQKFKKDQMASLKETEWQARRQALAAEEAAKHEERRVELEKMRLEEEKKRNRIETVNALANISTALEVRKKERKK